MNIFILNAGRCGSTTFIKSCQHIDNYTAANESRTTFAGENRLSYPDNHIEADNRLSWFLGRLDKQYGDNAIYVHLLRDRNDNINSFMNRTEFGIMKAYREGVYLTETRNNLEIYAADYIDTVNSNIEHFLKDKMHTMRFHLEHAKEHFREFWKLIGAEGDMQLSINEWDTRYNES